MDGEVNNGREQWIVNIRDEWRFKQEMEEDTRRWRVQEFNGELGRKWQRKEIVCSLSM